MTTPSTFKRTFKGASLEVEDLYLLETFQIGYFPGWVPERELAAVLWAYPSIKQFLVKKCPPINDFIKDVLSSRKAITCVVFAWHLYEWIWAQYKKELQKNPGLKEKSDYIQFLFTKCPELEVLQDLANGSKHFKSDRSTVAETKLSHGHASGLLLSLTQSHLIVETGQETYFIENLLSV